MATKTNMMAVMIIHPVDGGRACIGVVECPVCGKDHYTTQVRAGDLDVFCGPDATRGDGWSTISITQTL